MGTQITETGRVAAAKRPVTVGSQRLRIPASPPLGFMFKHGAFVRKIEAEQATDVEVETYYGEVIELLRRYNPKFSEELLLDECSLSDLLGFYVTWWGPGSGDADDEEEQEERPPQRRGTTGRTSTRTKSRS
jgi:hypothetical protein